MMTLAAHLLYGLVLGWLIWRVMPLCVRGE